MLLPFTGAHSQAREADCEPANRACVMRLCTRQQLRQLLARVEHARLDRVLRNANDLGYLFDRFLVVVHEINHLPMFRRKSRKALPDHCTLILLLQRSCGIVRQIFDRCCGLFVQLLVRSAPERAIASNHVVTVERPSNRPA